MKLIYSSKSLPSFQQAKIIASGDCTVFISLHIRSMWETICDAWACWSGWNFGPNSSRIAPILKYSFRIPPPQWKLSESPNPRVSEYPPKLKIVRESKSESFRIPPQQWKLSESPNPRSSEYPPKNENCQRVQIREVQNTPLPEESKSERLRIPPLRKWKLSESPNLRVSEYPPPQIGKLQISNFRIV